MALTQVSRGLLSTSIVDNGNAMAITIDSSENVGIGTSSPATALDVVGTVTADGLTVDKSGGNIAASFINSDSNNSYIQFQNSTTGTTTYTDGSLVGIDSDESLTIWQLESNHIKFGTSATERMRIDSSGNLGIGTSSPSQKLHVYESSTSSQAYVTVQNNRSRNAAVLTQTTNGGFYTGTSIGTDSLCWQVYDASAGERMRITSGGDLLVGTTSASGTSGEGIKLRKVSSDGVFHIVGATSTTAQDAIQVYSTGASAYRFFVQYNGQVNATSSSINAISDASLKQNIRDLDKGLEAILALQPRRFDWKNGDGNDIMGFVAQEVETVLPELVHDYKYSDEETKLGLKMGDMIPTLVKAIQEQQETITALTARIEQLENN